MSAAPADLRAAALSDLRHPSGTGTGRLALLLPDVPGEPFGGTATPAQRQATAEATGQPVPAFLFPGKATRPHDLRALLRAWAAAQTKPQPRWEISQADTRWELLPPDPAQVWDSGYAAGRADTAAEQANVSRPPHLYTRNPYRD